ncbi:MAG: hypothetical protein ACTSU5_11855, partial [Promethearchaeota archaeon]
MNALIVIIFVTITISVLYISYTIDKFILHNPRYYMSKLSLAGFFTGSSILLGYLISIPEILL